MSSPKKRGEGTSCHHCKKRIRPNEMLKCTRGEIVPTNSRKRKRPCVKKYCLHCIKTFYSNQYLDDNSSGSFICPACRDECRCAACRRRVMKARLKTDGSALENEADGQANGILESQTPDATNIEEGQVNGLLEILDSRPDVQDIIRRGMAMDFADDNAKILYVGHLIDQALTRPDVLALYYASSHGRANNCRIKTESTSNSTVNGNGTNGANGNNNDLPPELPMNEVVDSPQTSNSSTTSPSGSGSNGRHKRKRRSYDGVQQHGITEGGSPGHRSRRHRKGNGNKQRQEVQMRDDMEIEPLRTVKQEPSINCMNGMGQDGVHKNGHNGSMLSLNGISAPQPATISLSGGNHMEFINFPPPITSTNGLQSNLNHQNGINSNLPPIHLPFPGHNNGKIATSQIPLNPNIVLNTTTKGRHDMDDLSNSSPQNQTSQSENEEHSMNHNSMSEQNGSHNDNNKSNENDNIFPMNVTPSVTMGGPPLASM